MKRIFRLWLLLSSLLVAQQTPPSNVGFVRFMSLVGAGTGNTSLAIEGKDIWKKGYTLGQITGALTLRQGKHEFTVSREGCLTADRDITVEKGKSVTVISFAEEVFDEEGQSLGWQIKLASLKQHTPEKGLVVTFVSFCQEDFLDLVVEQFETKKVFKQTVKKRRSERLKLADSGRIRAGVSCNGEHIGAIKVEKPGNYVAMIFDTEEGKRMKVFYDPKFMISGS